MPTPLLNRLTFRERIMRHLVARFLAQKEGENGALITWDVVTRKGLTREEQRYDFAVGVYDTSERVVVEIGKDRRFVNVVLEFHAAISDGESDDVGTFANQVLGEVQRVAGLDIQMGEDDPDHPGQPPSYKLALNTEERGSELDVGGEKPTSISGVLILEVQYRTKNNNPFER